MRHTTIKDFPNYTIYEDGTILNHVLFRILCATKSRHRHVCTLCNEGNAKSRVDIPKLVAIHFVENNIPQNLTPTPSFIDGNYDNFHVNNLKWIARRDRPRELDNNEETKAIHRRYRQTDKGKFMRNKSHWDADNIREPQEGWKEFYFKTFDQATHCELCNCLFDPKNDYMSQRCLEHDHHSGYIRSICCRKCNTGAMKTFDHKRGFLMVELHRYFNLNN